MYYGVDFSGAKDAGRKIWVAELAEHRGKLLLKQLFPARNLSGGKVQRDATLEALVSFISQRGKDAIIGMDFPFCVPEEVMHMKRWMGFVASFGQCYSSADAFKSEVLRQADGRELKRQTDKESDTPFCPYNLRLYKQTFYGIRDVLGPLLQQEAVRVLLMQTKAPSLPSVVEVCPRSTLINQHQDRRYKGTTDVAYQARKGIVQWLEKSHKPNITFAEKGYRDNAIQDTEGDALDSIVAATATFRAGMNPLIAVTKPKYQLEGYVYL